MKTVIFGAGASYDSISEYYPSFKSDPNKLVCRPPLTRDLFQIIPWYEKLQRSFPGVRALLPGLKSANDIELFLQSKWDFATRHDAPEMLANLINTQFYLQELLLQCSTVWANAGISNYEALVGQAYEYTAATKQDVLFVSFNYDLLLEGAIRKWYFTMAEMMDLGHYVSSPIKLIKPHGSCNWFRPIKKNSISAGNQTLAHALFNSRINFQTIDDCLERDFVALSRSQNRAAQQGERLLFPQLVIPLRSKDDLVLPLEHVAVLIDKLKKTTELLVIGWKGQEETFLSLLKEHIGDRKIPVTIVCRNSSSIVKQALHPSLPNADFIDFNLNAERHISGPRDSGEYNELFEGGSFSSYVWNTSRGMWQSFFAL